MLRLLGCCLLASACPQQQQDVPLKALLGTHTETVVQMKGPLKSSRSPTAVEKNDS